MFTNRWIGPLFLYMWLTFGKGHSHGYKGTWEFQNDVQKSVCWSSLFPLQLLLLSVKRLWTSPAASTLLHPFLKTLQNIRVPSSSSWSFLILFHVNQPSKCDHDIQYILSQQKRKYIKDWNHIFLWGQKEHKILRDEREACNWIGWEKEFHNYIPVTRVKETLESNCQKRITPYSS